MTEFLKLNGTAVRTTGVYRRDVAGEHGERLLELELVVILRGAMAVRQFKHLLARDPIRIEIPKGSDWESWDATLQGANVASSGTGEAAAYRFDISLRETPESAARRRAEAPPPTLAPARPAPPPLSTPAAEDDDAPADLATVTARTDAAAWATALRQLKQASAVTQPQEPPLTATERAGIEAVLTNLRVDAVIDLLEVAGLVHRDLVEARFLQHVRTRFVAEAAPVVGEAAAKRAERDLLG